MHPSGEFEERNVFTEEDKKKLLESIEGRFYLIESVKDEEAKDKNKPKLQLLTGEYLINYFESSEVGKRFPPAPENYKKLWGLRYLMEKQQRFIDINKNDKEIYANLLSPEDFEKFGGETMDEFLYSEEKDLYEKIEFTKDKEYQEKLVEAINGRKSTVKKIHDHYYNEKQDYDYAFKAMKSPYKALQKSFHSLAEDTVKTQKDLDNLHEKAKNKSHKLKSSAHAGSNFLSIIADAIDDVTPQYEATHIAKTKDGKTNSKLKAFGYGVLRFAAKVVLPISVSRKRSFFTGGGALASIGNFALSTAASLVVPGALIGASFAFPPLAPVFLVTAAVYGVVFTIPALVKNIFNSAESAHLQRQKLKTTEMQKKGVDNSLESRIKKDLAKNDRTNPDIHHTVDPLNTEATESQQSLLTPAASSSSALPAVEITQGKKIATKLCTNTESYSDVELLEDAESSKYSNLESDNDKRNMMDKIYHEFKGQGNIKEIVKLPNSDSKPDCYLVTLQDENQPPFIVMDIEKMPKPELLEINVKGVKGVKDIKFTITKDKAIAAEVALSATR